MMIVLGIDPHDRNPHGVVFMAMDKDNSWVVWDELFEKCIITELAYKIKNKLGKLFPPSISVMDTSGKIQQSTSGISVKKELERLGIYTTDAKKDFLAGRLKVASLLDPGKDRLDPGKNKTPRLYVTKNCTNLIREFKTYSWDNWLRKRNRADPKEMPIKRDDHLLDAMRYVCMLDVVYRPPGFAHRPNIWNIPHNRVTGYGLGR